MLFQLFNVFNSRSEEGSPLRGVFDNRWLWGAVALSVTLQVCVVYYAISPPRVFDGVVKQTDWLRCYDRGEFGRLAA